MQSWEEILNMKWPQNACDQSGECCRGATQHQPWNALLQQAARGDTTARNFLNQFRPYPSHQAATESAPHAVEASLRIIQERGQKVENLVFYRCIYLQGANQCQIYEDRPTLCRDFPESPFSAIPACCGYKPVQQECAQKAQSLKQELARLKELQASINTIKERQ